MDIDPVTRKLLDHMETQARERHDPGLLLAWQLLTQKANRVNVKREDILRDGLAWILDDAAREAKP